jgi:hypothetical protein
VRPLRVRFTLRNAMLAVAVFGTACGITMWGTRMVRLRSLYLSQAARFGREETAMRKLAAVGPGGVTSRFNLKRATMMRNMKLYYERLARYPWLPDDAGSPARNRNP